MTHTTSPPEGSQRVNWMWKSNIDPWSSSEKEQWTSYTEIESIMIEEAYQDQAFEVLLDDYHINLKHFIQTSNENPSIQRQVKRVIQGEADRIKIREARFVPNEISPSKSFQQWENSATNFVFSVRDFFYLDDDFSLDDASSCQFMVEKAAEGLIIEGKLLGQQKIAAWMAKQLLQVKEGPKREVLKVCARLYSMDSFLFRKINELMRLSADTDRSVLLRDKLSTFGPFAFLLDEVIIDEKEKKVTVYRGATLSDESIEQYRNIDRESYLVFPAFTSTSRNPIVAEMFGGNTIFMIDAMTPRDAIDISPYSNMPDEEEFLLHAYFEFRVMSCSFDDTKKKWVIHLESFAAQ